MGVLLFVACKVTCMSPNQVQQPEGNVGRTVARVELGERKKDGRGGGGEEGREVSLFFQGVTECIIFHHLFANIIATLLTVIENLLLNHNRSVLLVHVIF